METIDWTEEFSVGVTLFDEQHKRLIAMLNKMIKDPTATTSSETVSDVITDMTQYASEHFKSEEDLMIKHGYPHTEQHRNQHQEFREKLVQICFATEEKVEIVPQVMLEYLRHWLAQHILHEDMAYKVFFKAKGVS